MRSPRRLFSGPVFPGRIVQGIHLPSISHWFHLHGRNLYKILDSCKQLTVSQSSGDDDTTGMVTIITGFQLEDPGVLSAPMQVGRTAALRPGAPHGAASCLLGAGGLDALCSHSAGFPNLRLGLGAPAQYVGALWPWVGALSPLPCAIRAPLSCSPPSKRPPAPAWR